MEWQQLMKLVCEIGFAPPVLVDVSPVTVNNPDLQTLLGTSSIYHVTTCVIFIIHVVVIMSYKSICIVVVYCFLKGDSKFCSATYRLFKIRLDDSIPSQAVTKVHYKGKCV